MHAVEGNTGGDMHAVEGNTGSYVLLRNDIIQDLLDFHLSSEAPIAEVMYNKSIHSVRDLEQKLSGLKISSVV